MTPLDCAVLYGSLGLHVFPCGVNAKGAKVPYLKRWQEIASTDAAQIGDWWGKTPGAMIGLAHRLSATLALDIDRHDGGASGWKTLMVHRIAGHDDPYTLAYRTASGGAQRILARPADLAALSGNYPGALGPGLDIILGYSILPSGDATPGREWVNAPGETWPAPAPDWIADAARKRADRSLAAAALPPAPMPAMPRPGSTADAASLRYVAAAVEGETADLAAVALGGRHDAIHLAACNIGRAIARAGRLDLATWAADAIASSGGWTANRVHRATIEDGLTWGLKHGSEA